MTDDGGNRVNVSNGWQIYGVVSLAAILSLLFLLTKLQSWTLINRAVKFSVTKIHFSPLSQPPPPSPKSMLSRYLANPVRCGHVEVTRL